LDYISTTDKQRKEMLEKIGVNSIEELFRDIPQHLFLKEKLKVNDPLSESELVKLVSDLSKKNVNATEYDYFLGAGIYNHYIPAAVPHLAFRSEFYTAYTPYQPEISQGNLQIIYEWQSFISELTGEDLANASVYDGATATADSMIMSKLITKRKEVLIAKSLNPEYKKVVETYAISNEMKVTEIGHENGRIKLNELKEKLNENVCSVIVQNPNFFGTIEELKPIIDATHEKGALAIVSVSEAVSMALLKSPGSLDADIVCGEGQSFGIPMSFGGPGVGFIACKQKHVRVVPGRIVGKTTDTSGKEGFIMTLQAREQHIRREKSFSNICTNQGLFALMATVHLSLLGKNGLKEVADLNLQKAHYAAKQISKLDGFELVFDSPFFNEFVIKTPDSKKVREHLLSKKIVSGFELGKEYSELENCIIFCVTEMNSKKQIDSLVQVLGEIR